MKQTLIRGLAVGSAVAIGALAFSPAAFAEGKGQMLQANLTPLNNSGASGTLTATLNGNTLKVKEHVTGVLANAPHAQHLHFSKKSSHTCPTAKAMKQNKPGDKNDKPFPFGNDKVVESVEARDSYGSPVVSLTTTGKYGASSALAIKRFPKPKNGTIDYSRTFNLSNEQAKNLKAGKFVAVVHGLDLNGNGKYDVFGKNKDLTRSSLAAVAKKSNNFPLEGTAPAACGVLTAMPTGGASTGGGATAGTEYIALFALGGAAVIAAGVLGVRELARADERIR
jgi:hypothetical protein